MVPGLCGSETQLFLDFFVYCLFLLFLFFIFYFFEVILTLHLTHFPSLGAKSGNKSCYLCRAV